MSDWGPNTSSHNHQAVEPLQAGGVCVTHLTSSLVTKNKDLERKHIASRGLSQDAAPWGTYTRWGREAGQARHT